MINDFTTEYTESHRDKYLKVPWNSVVKEKKTKTIYIKRIRQK